MAIKTVTYCVLWSILLLGCNSYETFYKETYTMADKALKPVQRLDVSQTTYDSIEKQLPLYDKLRFLDLSTQPANKIDTLLKLVARPELLRVLILDSTNLKRLPKSIRRFSNLKQLALNYNTNLDIGAAFSTLEGLPLVFLNLQHNDLDELPESITTLTALKDLNLSYNKIDSDISFSRLKRLPKLKSLWLTKNELKVLPPTLFQLDRLKNLYIEHNALSYIPEGIIGMKKLWVIHAGYNKFSVLPEAFSKMECLFLLHINNCEIEQIPESFLQKQSKVAGLILDHNKLSEKAKRYWKKALQHFFILSL